MGAACFLLVTCVLQLLRGKVFFVPVGGSELLRLEGDSATVNGVFLRQRRCFLQRQRCLFSAPVMVFFAMLGVFRDKVFSALAQGGMLVAALLIDWRFLQRFAGSTGGSIGSRS